MLQGLDIPDVLIVVQWKVPKDLNTLVQRFGRAVRNPDLQGVAILIAEPGWFYETRLSQEASRKRKRGQDDDEVSSENGESEHIVQQNNENLPPSSQPPTIPSQPQLEAHTSTRTQSRLPLTPRHVNATNQPMQDPSRTGNELGHSREQGENGTNTNHSSAPLRVDRESRLATLFTFAEEKKGSGCRTGAQTAHGKSTNGSLQRSASDPVDKSLCYFVNAHVLALGGFCRRYHTDQFYTNHLIGMLNDILAFRHYTDHLLDPNVPFCCERCALKKPTICCDLCCPDQVLSIIPERNDTPNKPPRAPNKVTIKDFVRSPNEDALARALREWRSQLTLQFYGSDCIDAFGPDVFMHFSFIDRIVGLAHEHRLKSTKDIIDQVRWNQVSKYASHILDLVREHCPELPPPSPFVHTPMAPRRSLGEVNDPRRRAAPRCSRCGEIGHKSALGFLFSSRLLCVAKILYDVYREQSDMSTTYYRHIAIC